MSTAISVALAAYLAFVSPWLGKHSYARLKRDRDRDEKALTRRFGRWMVEWWALAGLALLAVDLDLARIGLVLPGDLATTAGLLVGAAVAIAVTSALGGRGTPLPGREAFAALIPRTRAERRFALGMAVTAGVCEEIVYRGLLIDLGMGVMPEFAAAGLALAVFVAGHLYQGWRGMLTITFAGLAFTMMYLMTGSLLIPILVHALVDIRSLLFIPVQEHDIDRTATVRG